MIRAYSELYLNDAKARLSELFDYLISECGMDADWAASIFLSSGYAEQFERGDPSVLSGMSGVELAEAVIQATYKNKVLPGVGFSEGLSPEYWAGWALAHYQWHSARRFRDIFERVKLSEMIRMYPAFHEMDVSEFIDAMDARCEAVIPESRLKRLRESRGLSQSELARISGVSLRSIQMYEQHVNDIDKAQAHTMYKLSRTIGCSMEDLLEDPMAG